MAERIRHAIATFHVLFVRHRYKNGTSYEVELVFTCLSFFLLYIYLSVFNVKTPQYSKGPNFRLLKSHQLLHFLAFLDWVQPYQVTKD